MDVSISYYGFVMLSYGEIIFSVHSDELTILVSAF